MGDLNQLTFVKRHRGQLRGPFLEVGSHDYGSTQDLRALCPPDAKYVGVDMHPGPGVDLVLDLIGDFDTVDAAVDGERFGTIFCLSVLEHCDQPFRMAENLSRLLRTDGHILISVPFAWQFHGYPSDYWRFTHEGVKKLFPLLEFDPDDGVAATARNDDFAPLDHDLGKIPFSASFHRAHGRPVRGLVVKVMRLLARVGPLAWLAGYSYVLAPTMVSMVGRPRVSR